VSLTPRRVSVLRELDWLDRESPRWARDNDGWWLPYHVVYFRGAGRAGRGSVGAPSWAYGMSVDAAQRHCRELHRAGLADKLGPRQGEYRITDAGREALAEWDRGAAARVLG
jgi:hypothetical protein